MMKRMSFEMETLERNEGRFEDIRLDVLERKLDVVDLRILEILQKKIKLNKPTIWDRLLRQENIWGRLKWLEENLYIERIKEDKRRVNVLLQPTLKGTKYIQYQKILNNFKWQLRKNRS